MHQAEIDSIIIPPGRIRRDFSEDAIKELAISISRKGLMNPVTCREENGQLKLVAGENRLRAMRSLIEDGIRIRCNGEFCGDRCVPFLYLTELDAADAYEAELEENVCRQDLTFIEQVEARKKLFDLRAAEAAKAGRSYSAEDMADELHARGASNASADKIRKDLSIARFLDKPEVREAKNYSEAVKAAKRSTENFLTEALGDMLSASPPPKHTLIEGDSCELLSGLEPNRFDCVCTDPPYGIGIDDSGSMVANAHHYADGSDVLERILDRVPDQLYRITRAQAHVYWFCDLRWFAKISHALEEAGFSCCPFPIIWWKRGKAMVPDATRWPKREYECVLYAIKGDKPPLKVAGDVISTAYGSDLQQAEKPKELFVELLSRSVLEGAQVIDPFCGSGVIFSAADELKCNAVGIELDAARAGMAKIRAYGMEGG